MNCVAAHGAIARGGEAHRQAGRSRGVHIEIGVVESLIGEISKRDRLVRLRDAESARDNWCGVVIIVAALRSIDLARARRREMNQSATYGAISGRHQVYNQSRTRR